MKVTGLSPWDNLWNDVMDITTKRASMSTKSDMVAQPESN